MASGLTVLLLGCWLAGRSGVSGQGTYPKPSISVSPSEVIPVGGDVTIRCWREEFRDLRFFLYKDGDGNYLTYKDVAGSEAEFPILSVRWDQRGNYTCRIHLRIGNSGVYSEPSDPVQIIVVERTYPKPSISVSPSGVIPVGGDVTIRCWRDEYRGMRFLLYKDGDGNYLSYTDQAGSEAEFPILSVRWDQRGNYTCRFHPGIGNSGVYSEPSDPVQIIVVAPSLPKPSISISPSGGVSLGEAATIRCGAGPLHAIFLLYKDGGYWGRAVPMGDVAEFHVASVREADVGIYSCSYLTTWEPVAQSYPSDPAWLAVRGGTEPTQPGMILAPTHPGHTSQGESPTSLTLSSPMIAGVSAAAALLLLLLLAFVCFRKARTRKGSAPRTSSASPLGALKAPAQQEPVYDSVDERKERQTSPHKPDPDGLTYAEVDHQMLHAKRGAPEPEPVQHCLYAAINTSQGATH